VRAPISGLPALSAFFLFGALASSTACVTLLIPGTVLDQVWRLNPRGHDGLVSLGAWAAALMFFVSVACAATARGVWTRARWGHRLAVIILSVNVVADAANAIVLDDFRTLIGIPIGGAVIAYLLSRRVRATFRGSDAVT
jgi:hypothetical protein